MMNDKQWNDLVLEHELAYLRGGLATSSPESYTIEEMKAISDDMFASTAEAEAALRADFDSMSPYAQSRMLDMLKKTDSSNYGFWLDLLVGGIPNCPTEISIGE